MWNCLNRADVGTSSAFFFFKAAPVAQHPEAVCLDGSTAVVLGLFPHAKYLDCPSLELIPQQLPATSFCCGAAEFFNN